MNISRRFALKSALAAIVTPGLTSFAKAVTLTESTALGVIHEIQIEAAKFVPAKLNIMAGDSVRWINKDIVPHTATGTADRWDTGFLATSQSKVIVFDQRGSFDYLCLYHPSMKANIEVI